MSRVELQADSMGIYHAVDPSGSVCKLVHLRNYSRMHFSIRADARKMQHMLDIGSMCPVCYNKVTGLNYTDGIDEYVAFVRQHERLRPYKSPFDKVVPGQEYTATVKRGVVHIKELSLERSFQIVESHRIPGGTKVVVLHKPTHHPHPSLCGWGILGHGKVIFCRVESPGVWWHKTLKEMGEEAMKYVEEAKQLIRT